MRVQKKLPLTRLAELPRRLRKVPKLLPKLKNPLTTSRLQIQKLSKARLKSRLTLRSKPLKRDLHKRILLKKQLKVLLKTLLKITQKRILKRPQKKILKRPLRELQRRIAKK